MRPIETNYRGCRFRSRIEARWAVFFDALGFEWWYEPEGFALRFDYEKFAADWDRTIGKLVRPELRQPFEGLAGKEYLYLPDFYLPELNYWIEVKGPNPTREEIEKAFMLSHMASNAVLEKIREAKTEAERRSASDDFRRLGVFIIYGDIPWPFPQKGNIYGYTDLDSVTNHFHPWAALAESGAEDPKIKEHEYRNLLQGHLKLCWQECPLCLRIGVREIEKPHCLSCRDQVVRHIWDHLVEYKVISEAGTQDRSDQFWHDPEIALGTKPPDPASMKALQLTKDLMNPKFFTSGHKSPRLQKAYSKARSARFEHGQSP